MGKIFQNKYFIGLIILLIIIIGIIAIFVLPWKFRKILLEVYFLHLDRGQGIFIVTPHNKTILINGGQNTQVLEEMTKILPFYVRNIDIGILTSSSAKDAGGLADVAKRYDIGKIIEPSIIGTSTALSALEKVLKEKDIPLEKFNKNEHFELDGIIFNVLFPDPNFKFNKTSQPELVLSLSYGSTSMLFLGDVSKTIQKSLTIGKADLVEYGNSGGKSLSDPGLLNRLNPTFIITNKEKNTLHFSSDGINLIKN